MIKRLFPLALALAACGGPGINSVTSADLSAHAPTYDKLALAQSDADMAAPGEAPGSGDVIQQNETAPSPTGAICHPHLFDRSHEVVGRVNRHFFKHLRHVEELIKQNPTLKTGGTATWENVKDGIDRKLTITATVNADSSVTYAFELDLKSTGAFVKVMDGAITHKGAEGARVESSGNVKFDFTALHSAIAKEKATGQIETVFDTIKDPSKPAPGEKRTATVTLTAFLPEEGDKRGPRTGKYVWAREPGIGGSLEFQDTMVLRCPDNPASSASDLIAVSRWYKATDGAMHGRTDAQATGGQIAAGNKWMGVTCAQGKTTRSAHAEGYWMMKLENAAGATLVGHADLLGASPCDPALGGVPPSVSDNAHDFPFAGLDFSAPYPFPNQW